MIGHQWTGERGSHVLLHTWAKARRTTDESPPHSQNVPLVAPSEGLRGRHRAEKDVTMDVIEEGAR